MKKDLIKNDVVEQLLRRFNPLGLRDRTGHPYEFMRVSELYLQVMVQTFVKFPRGYIETPLLLAYLYPHLSYKECKDIAESMKPLGVEVLGFYEYDRRNGREFFERFLKALHSKCETPYKSDEFAEAYRLLLNRLEIEKLNQKKKQNEKERQPNG